MLTQPNGNELEQPESHTRQGEPGSPGKEQYLAEDFDELAENIYEAIIVVARRARKIGEDQRREIDKQIGTLDLSESAEDESIEEDEEEPHYIRFEKPTMIAMSEMSNGKLKYYYKK